MYSVDNLTNMLIKSRKNKLYINAFSNSSVAVLTLLDKIEHLYVTANIATGTRINLFRGW